MNYVNEIRTPSEILAEAGPIKIRHLLRHPGQIVIDAPRETLERLRALELEIDGIPQVNCELGNWILFQVLEFLERLEQLEDLPPIRETQIELEPL